MIARKSSLVFISRIAIAALSFVAVFFVGHYMGPYPLGIIGFGMGFIGLFSFLANLGFDTAHIKQVSEGKDLRTCIGTYVLIKAILVALMVAMTLAAVAIWRFVLHRSFDSPEQQIALYILVLFFILDSLNQIMLSTFAARQETARQQLPSLAGSVLQVVAMVLVALLWRNVIALVATYVLGSMISLAISLYFFSGYGVGKPSKEYFRSYLKFAFPLMLVSALGMFQVNVDKVMLQFFWGTLFVGYYFSAQRVTQALDYLSQAAGTLFLPAISSLSSRNDLEQVRHLTRVYERYVSLFVVPAATLVIVFAEQVVHIALGDEFLPAVPILRLLAVFMALNSLSRPHSYQIIGIGRPDVGAKISVISGLTNIVLNAILIPGAFLGLRLAGLGGTGAAAATVIAAAISNVLIRIATYKLSGTRPNRRILYHFLAAGIMGSVLYMIELNFTVLWYHIFPLSFLGLATYLAVLFLCREFTGQDIKFIRDVANPLKMKEYVTSELGGNGALSKDRSSE